MSSSLIRDNEAVTKIPGYDYGRTVTHSPLSLDELHKLEETVGWSSDDAAALQRHPEVFRDQAEAMVDAWRAVIGKQEHLAKWFFGRDGKRDEQYAAKVKKRFVQWVTDVAFRPHDQVWLDYQEEIGLRHTPEKKNQTDGARTPPVVPLRYLFGFVPMVTIGARKFFVEQGIHGDELVKVEVAWNKVVLLHVTLWSRPYAKEGLW